jgi:hypothetical protein
MQGEDEKKFIHTAAEGYLIIGPMSGQPHASWQVTNDRQVDRRLWLITCDLTANQVVKYGYNLYTIKSFVQNQIIP